jgi:hypothetical protein
MMQRKMLWMIQMVVAGLPALLSRSGGEKLLASRSNSNIMRRRIMLQGR